MEKTIEEKLAALLTLSVGQAADLKLDTGTLRVWLSRCTEEDGETRPIQVERLTNGRWLDLNLPIDQAETLAYFYINVGQRRKVK